MKQIHKRFRSEQVKELLRKYKEGIIKRECIEKILTVGKAQFLRLMKRYRSEQEGFSMEYGRKSINNISNLGFLQLSLLSK